MFDVSDHFLGRDCLISIFGLYLHKWDTFFSSFVLRTVSFKSLIFFKMFFTKIAVTVFCSRFFSPYVLSQCSWIEESFTNSRRYSPNYWASTHTSTSDHKSSLVSLCKEGTSLSTWKDFWNKDDLMGSGNVSLCIRFQSLSSMN